MNSGCTVGFHQLLTVDDRYFQKPPAEQFISPCLLCTVLLNNAQWWKTPAARCSDAQLRIHEQLIAAFITLFIWLFHVFIFHTTCWKSLSFGLFNFQSARCSSFISINRSFRQFASFAQRKFMSVFVRIRQGDTGSDSSQSAVSFLILVPMMCRGKALINTNLTIWFVCSLVLNNASPVQSCGEQQFG